VSEQPDLVTDEGVDEGSAASATEDRSSGSDAVLGAPPRGAVEGESDPAPPDHVPTPDLPTDPGPGQELAAGEG
jgi:hypothetical protein